MVGRWHCGRGWLVAGKGGAVAAAFDRWYIVNCKYRNLQVELRIQLSTCVVAMKLHVDISRHVLLLQVGCRLQVICRPHAACDIACSTARSQLLGRLRGRLKAGCGREIVCTYEAPGVGH